MLKNTIQLQSVASTLCLKSTHRLNYMMFQAVLYENLLALLSCANFSHHNFKPCVIMTISHQL